MFNVKLLNKIAVAGMDLFDKEKYNVSENAAAPAAILVRSAQMLDYAFNKELRCVARAGVGINNIPLERCSREGIVVFYTPGANANAVKELAIAALLLASRDIVGGIKWARELEGKDADIAKEVESGKNRFEGPELRGKTLGIIGLGAVGALIANAAIDLGMKVTGYDPYLTVDAAWQISGKVSRARDINAIYANSDYISIHVPLTDETRHTINAESLSKTREGVRIINLARAELIDNAAVGAAMENGRVAAYVTDFPTNDLFQKVPRAIAIPHLGASTPEAEDNCAAMAAELVMDFLENGNIKNSANFPDMSLPRSAGNRICAAYKNIPEISPAINRVFQSNNINIAASLSRSKGEYAYTMLDTDDEAPEDIEDALMKIDGVMRVMIL